MLECDVSTRRGRFEIEATLAAPSGVTALVGRSGAGKTSLLRLLAGLDRPDRGRIALEDEVWCDTGARRFVPPHRRRVGMVFQMPHLLPHRSVMGNVTVGARGRPVSAELMQRIGVAGLVAKPVASLSGGEQQRVMLARALAGGPQLLLFDEPLSALDVASRDVLLELFGTLLPTLGVPVVYVTHSFEEAGRVADRFALIREGRIIAAGDAAHVLRRSAEAGAGLDAAVGAVLTGVVHDIASDGLAEIVIGGQKIEVPAAGLMRGHPAQVRLWARDLILAREVPRAISARNALTGVITDLTHLSGGRVLVGVEIERHQVRALVTARTVGEMRLASGQPIVVLFKSAGIERRGA